MPTMPAFGAFEKTPLAYPIHETDFKDVWQVQGADLVGSKSIDSIAWLKIAV